MLPTAQVLYSMAGILLNSKAGLPHLFLRELLIYCSKRRARLVRKRTNRCSVGEALQINYEKVSFWGDIE